MLDLALAVLFLLPMGVIAQNTVGASGGSGTTASGTVSWTVGQPVTSTVTDGEHTLTQGFQQPWAEVGTGVEENTTTASDIRVYPNPTRHLLNVEMPGANEKNELQLLDATGRIVLQAPATGDRTELDLHDYGTGNYFLRIWNAEGDLTRTFKIIINH